MDAKADTVVKGSAASMLGLRSLEADVDSMSTFRTKKVIDSDRGPCGLIVRWTRCISMILPQYEEALRICLRFRLWQYLGVYSSQDGIFRNHIFSWND